MGYMDKSFCPKLFIPNLIAFISGASMNPARSLAPAVLSGVMTNLWLYWTATFIGTSVIALLLRKKFIRHQKPKIR